MRLLYNSEQIPAMVILIRLLGASGIIAFLIMNGYVYWYLGSAEVVPDRATFASFPDQVDSHFVAMEGVA